ncbi:MAG TPA: ELWxxDGT repeat protein [Thermoanaerobaculia bacterium]|nr:ELWxxDGT repeat protein [Thermoanaerobaculia bacterium]
MPRYLSWRSIVSAGLFVFSWALAAGAQPHLVTDLNQGRVAANLQPLPSAGIEQDGVLYFPGQDPQHGYELWRSDGTAEGTYRLADLCPGSCWGGGQGIGVFNGFLYFLGNDREHGVEIWRTDGTVGGEELLGDLCPGECGIGLSGWVERDGALWFLTQGFGETPILWTSDGSPAGTRQVANLCTDLGICGFVDYSYAFLAGPDPSGQGFVLWTSTDALSLYRTDGTAAGTELLHRFTASFLSPQDSKNGGKGSLESLKAALGPTARTAVEATEPLFFLEGFDLWTSDGTPAGTRLVRNVEGLIGTSSYLQSTRVIDGIWYAIFDYGDWLRSDGTAEGTFPLAHVDSQFRPTLARIGDAVYVVTVHGVWRAGATPETTVRFDGPVGDVLAVIERPGRLYVMGWNQAGFVWSTDGTPAGTRRHHLDGPPNPDQYEIGGFGDGVMVSVGYRELWRIDQRGAERVRDFQPSNGGSGPVDQISFGRRLLFISNLGERGAKLFSTDGTAAGTAAISPYFGSQAYRLTRAGDRAFFTTFGRVWTSDGTAAGTRSFRPAYSSSSHELISPIGVVGDRFVFGANFKQYPLRCEPGDTEPWVSDGTQRGTKQILNLNPFVQPGGGSQCETVAVSSSPGPGVSLGSFALFAADDLLHGRELFATDGTKEGTRRVADLNPKLMPNTITDPTSPPHAPDLVGVGSNPSDLVRAGSRAFFVADDGTTGRELWVTNGTRRGTRRVADLVPGPGSSTPRNLVAVGDGIYFFAADGAGEGLYKSDGTQAGTVRVSDLAGVSQARELTVARGSLFFVAFRPSTGTELWVSRGTAASTREVTDLRPGPRGSLPQNLKAVGARVVFAAEDGTSGLEPWSSDGTAEGTLRWGDIAPGSAASSPGPFSVASGQILFGADDGEHGRELWAIPVANLVD